ncbi:hypothetical protein [Thermosphaera chiliense]|nr:hypothetical protein [Thermosphaera aggregans]
MVDERAKQVEEVLSGIEVPGFDVDVIRGGLVTGFRISWDGKK